MELYSADFWHQGPLPVFRETRTGFVSPYAFSGGHVPTPDEPWVTVRGLYPPQQEPQRITLFGRMKEWLLGTSRCTPTE
jgi:hypothetical protein